jgi:hypothetical protein
MRIEITIDCENDSFGPNELDLKYQVAQILDDCARRVRRITPEDRETHITLRDVNGNSVGTLSLIEDKDG